MASRRGGSGEEKKEDALTIGAVMFASVAMMVFLIWMSSSTKIVHFWTPKLAFLSGVWLWLPGDIGLQRYNEIINTANAFAAKPWDVKFFDWMSFYSNAVFMPTLLVSTAVGGWLLSTILATRVDVKRKFKPQHLAVHLSHVFTGIAPVLHLRKALAQDKEPYWRRQTFPHEVLLNVRVGGKPLVTDPLNGDVVLDRVAEYFRGISFKKTTSGEVPAEMIGGRPVSKMLGRQVVHLITDQGKNPCFPDRFSNTGKIIYALLCAHAFGGEQGKKDYALARDQINNSCRGAPHGFANLTVAQWLFDKYRMNPMARKLFAIHHWEYTYLYELARLAKRQGKVGHWEYMWLKPMNRILFYSQNTMGRFTPHTESASVFCQYIYERRVAKRGRLPLMQVPGGAYVHVIFIDKAVKALALEWARWRDGDEDDELWWTDENIWKRLNGINFAPPLPPPASLMGETAFDKGMTQQAVDTAKKQDEERAATLEEFSRKGGSLAAEPNW